MRLKFAVTFAALLAGSSAAESQKIVAQKAISVVPAPVLLDNAGMFQERYARVGDDMFIGGQPTERALRDLKAQGVTTVINLRMPEEMARIGFDEQKLIAELGMKYVHIPLRTGSSQENAYSPANLKRFSDAMQAADGKVLLHCTVAWRASHIWAAYLIERGVADSAAVKHARAINLMDDHRMDPSGKQPLEMFLGRTVQGLGRP